MTVPTIKQQQWVSAFQQLSLCFTHFKSQCTELPTTNSNLFHYFICAFCMQTLTINSSTAGHESSVSLTASLTQVEVSRSHIPSSCSATDSQAAPPAPDPGRSCFSDFQPSQNRKLLPSPLPF